MEPLVYDGSISHRRSVKTRCDLNYGEATMQIDLAMNIKYLQMQMGHSSVSTSFDIYDHLMKTETPEAASKLVDSYFGK